MKFFFKAILAVVCLLSGFSMYAREILTPWATHDYERRLHEQPQLRDILTLPSGLTPAESAALTFLYAYMPTSDLLDYDSDFFLENVRIALEASRRMPWGDLVPDREWRHFVLPLRVNNEDLDLSRKVFYEELRPRLEGMSMEEAILEVNHWCHEKVSYQPSDPRTSSPLATVANALGRCGEESTFTVTALRSVGIPARQVYTPRWAHTDDNHAWVEAWADGKWHFLGACEPEAVLDLAWFNASAARGMLMTTKVTGVYDGPEEQIETLPVSTVINVTGNYAPVVRSSVCVTDRNGNPVKNAKVRFCIYNYAEFYPLAEKLTDSDGRARFTSGCGDLIIWASDGKRFNLARLKAGDTITIPLDKDSSFTGTIDFDLSSPPPGGNTLTVSDEASYLNDKRKAYEDSLRLEHIGTFLTLGDALKICHDLGLEDSCAERLVESRANHSVIEGFLRNTAENERPKAAALLKVLSEKDLHDITAEALSDHLYFTEGDKSSSIYDEYVLNPRIEFELIRPYKKAVRELFTDREIARFVEDPRQIEEFIRNNVTTDTLYNPESYRQSAVSTLTRKIADPLNKALTFVAVCRALGIPARFDPISHKAQFADSTGLWHDAITPGQQEKEGSPIHKSVLHIEDKSDLKGRTPKYYSQFTVSRMEGGLPILMEFDDFETIASVNSRREPIEPGQYFLLSGQRLADGTVLARGEFFLAWPEKTSGAILTIRQDPGALQVIGSLNSELIYTPIAFTGDNMTAGEPQTILSATGRGYYVIGIISPGHEPSAHAINDISDAAEGIAASGRKLLLLFPDKDSARHFRPREYGKLPGNVIFGIDNGSIVRELQEGLELKTPVINDLPIIAVADSFNRIIFAQQGYAIRLGDTLSRILDAVSEH